MREGSTLLEAPPSQREAPPSPSSPAPHWRPRPPRKAPPSSRSPALPEAHLCPQTGASSLLMCANVFSGRLWRDAAQLLSASKVCDVCLESSSSERKKEKEGGREREGVSSCSASLRPSHPDSASRPRPPDGQLDLGPKCPP